MNSLIIDNIIKKLQETINFDDDMLFFSEKGYKAIKILEENFHKLETTKSDRKIAFIDGGNAEILKAPNFSLQFIRVYAALFSHNRKIYSKKHEFYALITAENSKDILYKTKLFPSSLLNEQNLIFHSYDKTLVSGINRASLSKIADVIRRFAELQLAVNMLDEMHKDDIVILDGDLQAKYTKENEYLEKLYTKAEKKNITITALSKTSQLLTQNGNSLSVVLLKKAPFDEWYYYPIAEITSKAHQAEMYFLKLHKNSRYIFKFEIYNKQNHDPKIFGLLKEQAKDPIFLGYPYGLIDADRYARVSNSELDYIKTKFLTKLGNEFKDIQSSLNAVNAHDILDSIS